ncbi:MAG: hypothetical protein IIW91_03735 [Alistipes sp.]|nr:hypothetical protein [Alistipes sp.]
MYNIKHGYGCGIKATLLTASGEVCDLRRARYKGAVLVLPNGSTIPCADVSVDDITNTMYVRLLGDRELTTIGRYGILFNVKLANGVMYSSPIIMFADVQGDAEMEYRELNISIAVTVTYLPANVAYTGASPKISPNGTWLVYNDELNAYEDTGEPASYAGVAGNIQELHEQIEERTTTTYITEAVDVDWKTVGKNAEGKLCVIGGDTQVADFIEGYLLANGYAKLSELAKIFASIEWIEGKKYITDADIPSLVSAFTNDKGYITLDAIAPYAKKATTLGGYGITNAYTKEETESRFFAFTKIDNETIKRNEDGFMYVDFSNVPTSIFDGLPIDNETIYWDNGVLKAMGGGGGGGVADSVAWANVTGKPKWLQDAGNAKPTYNYSEIQGTPDLSEYALATAIPTNNNQLTNGAGYITSSALNGYATQSWVNTALAGYLPLSGGTLTDALTVKGSGSPLTVHRTQSLASVVKFVNTDGNLGWLGVDIDKTAIFMEASGVIKKLLHSGNYSDYALPIKGGMIYGNGADLLGINRIDGNPAIVFYHNNTTMGRLGFDTSGDAVAQVGGEYKKILHAGNYSNYALPKDGTAASATKLATPRTIWGQSFDGTGNVLANKGVGLMSTQNYYGLSILPDTSVYGVRTFLTYDEGSTMGAYEISTSYTVGGLSIGVATGLEYNTTIIPSAASYTPVVVIKKNGNVAIGGTTANAKLHVYGNLLTEGGITMYSQRSLKNILSYEGLSLEQLSVIKPIKFTWKDGRDNRYHVGGVADDVATVVPEVVYSTNDFLTMDYGNAGFYVAASLIKPVIDHEQRIKILEQENKALRDEINQLKQAA